MTLTTEQLKTRIEALRNSASGIASTFSGDADALEELLRYREAQPAYQYRMRNPYNGQVTDWETIKPEQVDFILKETIAANVEFRIIAAPPAPANAQPVAWEMRYWNSGYNIWGDWECITAEQHAEMSVQHATSNDYEFRVLYDAPPAPAVPREIMNCLAFFASAIKSGEPWTVTCQRDYDAACRAGGW